MASPNDFRITHCTEQCGRVLVGAAKIIPNSMQWVGAESARSISAAAGGSFGFTGALKYRNEPVVPNQWNFETLTSCTLGDAQPSGGAPALGFYFAPEQAGTIATRGQYLAVLTAGNPVQLPLSLSGEGVEDNESAPALTLDINTRGGSATGNATDVAQGDKIVFAVTPRQSGALPAGVEAVEHVWVDLYVVEEGTFCESKSQSFRGRPLTPLNLDPSQYFQYMYEVGREITPNSCRYQVSFLTSINSTFEFEVASQRGTEGGRVRFIFALRGHFDLNNPNRWPGSQKAFSLISTGVSKRFTRSWPLLGTASGIDPAGRLAQQIPGVSIFAGIEYAGTLHGSGLSLQKGAQVAVGAKIDVHRDHEGKTAGVLVLLGYQQNPTTSMQLSFQTAAGGFEPWNGASIAAIGARSQVTLEDMLDFDLYEGPLAVEPGIYSLFFGYRLADNSTVFNAVPLSFTVVP